MFKSISSSLTVYFCPFFSLFFFHRFFFAHFSLFPHIFFLSFVICFVSDTIFCPTPGPSREGPEGPPNTPLVGALRPNSAVARKTSSSLKGKAKKKICQIYVIPPGTLFTFIRYEKNISFSSYMSSGRPRNITKM